MTGGPHSCPTNYSPPCARDEWAGQHARYARSRQHRGWIGANIGHGEYRVTHRFIPLTIWKVS